MKGRRSVRTRLLSLFLTWVLLVSFLETDTGTVYASEAAERYSITVEEAEHGLIAADRETAAEGETVAVTVTPEEGWQVQAFQVAMEDDIEVPFNVEEQEETIAYSFVMPAGAVHITAALEEKPGEETKEILISASGENLSFTFDREDCSYEPGSTVTVTLTPDTGCILDLESLTVNAADGEEIEYQVSDPDANGAVTLTFAAAETDILITAEAQARPQHSVVITSEVLDQDPSVLSGSAEAAGFYEGAEVTVRVTYTGSEIWTATVTCGSNSTDLEFTATSETITFIMPDEDVEVTLSEREAQNIGDLSAEDGSITGDWQGNTSSVKKENEPDVELGKSARWTAIEDGYAELTITEKDTSDYSNKPVDYIIILDRTRTMSLSQATWEQGGQESDIKNTSSPCINPNHYYYKGGISLGLKDYFTGVDRNSGYWFDELEGGADSWTKRHYNEAGQKITTSYSNSCQDRLTMAKQAIYELIDRIEENNKDVSAGMKSRVAYWSFADGTSYGEQSIYRLRGLFNYTPWTENYASVKTAVSQTKTFSGTYYTKSLEQVYRMITERNSTDSKHSNHYTKVIFISDGLCGDGPANGSSRERVQELASQIKSLPNTELFTIAMGMPSDSEGARFLASLATQKPDGTYTAALWQNLSFSGDKNSALAEAFFNIDSKGMEVKAVNKVLTDQIETKYWEPVEVLRADGGLASVTLNKNTGKLTWNVPEGAGKTYSCTVKLKLKDEYRYLLSDTSYPTNRDGGGADADPAKAGATMSYTINGGIYHTETRKTGIVTPKLKYGTVKFTGKKNWTVSGSQTAAVTVRLMRTLPSQTAAIQVNNAVTNASRNWTYNFDVRLMPDGSTKPLIKYDENGRTVRYEVTESIPAFYSKLENVTTNGKPDQNGGVLTDSQLYNEPYKIKAQIQKVDEETKNPLSGAVFTVYTWSEKAGKYVPYKGTTNKASKPYETGAMTGAPEAMTLKEETKGTYITPSWLYYSPDNQGKFRVIETSAPEGYYGDWADDAAVTENSADSDKNVYDFTISSDAAQNGRTVTVSNENEGTFGNQRVLGRISFSKNDLEAQDTIAQGDATLEGAVYRLYAAEDIVHQDGTTGILYRKDEEIKVSLTGIRAGVRKYRYHPEGTEVLTVGDGYTVVIDGLELGSYYLKEETPSDGYLVDPAKYCFDLTWQGEKVPVVEIKDYKVYEQVKKQALSFYKVTGTDNTDKLDPMKGAKFSVYLVSDLANGKYVDVPDEELPQAIIDDYRNPATLGYEAFRGLLPAVVYDEADSEDVTSGKLVKSITYSDGTTVEADGSNENAYLSAELESNSKGIVTTPKLPYGRYVVIETTTPENTTAARPFVINVKADDEDGTVDGDGQGSRLDDLVILMDRPIMALVRILKTDSQSKKAVLKEGAAYLIHDVDGAWFDYYTKEMTTAQKSTYKAKYGDLVAQYNQGVYLGTEENPYATKLILSETDETANVYIETPKELPAGTYELEEISAPEGYIVQGKEGVIAKNPLLSSGNHTYYEKEEDGKWEATPQGATRFVVSSSEAVYDSNIGAYIVTAKQQNDPAVGKISIYAEGEQLVSAKQEGSTILTRLGDTVSRFFGYVKGLIGLDTADEQGMTEAELSEYKDYVFAYEMRPIEGAQFEIRASEDIYSQEGGANAELLYHAGDLVVTLTTDADGQTWTGQEDWEETDIAKGLPLGKYTVTQKKAGYGFALSEENAAPRELEITYAGQEVPVIYRDTSYTNPRQKVQIAVTKKDKETENLLAGAVFGLYAEEDIENYKGRTVVKAGTLIATAETTADADGQVQDAVFAPDLPLAKYYVKELKAPYGYAANNTKITVDATYREDQREVISLTGTVKNAPIRVQINLMDYFTDVELDGAALQVVDEDGNAFTTFLTVHNDNPVIYGLEEGKAYTVTELTSPEGYHINLYIKDDYVTEKDGIELDKNYADKNGRITDSITFTVRGIEELQVVSVFNKPFTGELTIAKKGEVFTGTEKNTDADGDAVQSPIYEIQGLPGAEYILRAADELEYPDGYSGILFQKGELILDEYAKQNEQAQFQNFQIAIEEGTGSLEASSGYVDMEGERITYRYVLLTDKNGLVRLGGLPSGSYEIIEIKAPKGYYRDPNHCMQSVTIGAPADSAEQAEAVVHAESTFVNERQKARIKARKLDLETGERLPGAVLGLYAAEDIRDAEGAALIRSGTLLEKAVTDANGEAEFSWKLPFGSYDVKEIQAPAGYLLSGDVQNFVFTYTGDAAETKEFDVTIQNQPGDVKLEVDKSAPEQVQRNETYLYTLERVRNAGNCMVDHVTLTDILPEQVRLTELWTGTFEGLKDADSYSVWYQTDKHTEYRLWKDNIPAYANTRLAVSELPLSEDEAVTSFRYQFGSVKKNFKELEKPVYAVQVKEEVSGPETIENIVYLQGDKRGIPYMAEDHTLTYLEQPDPPEEHHGSGTHTVTASATGDTQGKFAGLWMLCTGAALLSILLLIRKRYRRGCF